MHHFFIPAHGILICNNAAVSNLFTSIWLPVITAAIGIAIGYFFSRKLLKLERNADFQKMLDEEQLHAHKKLYAAAKHVSVRKENPFAMAYKQKDGKVFLRRKEAAEFVNDISAFLSSEDGAFIDKNLSHPLWGLRNLVFAILDIEKASGEADIELTKKGEELVNYIETFHNNFRDRFSLRGRGMINIEPK